MHKLQFCITKHYFLHYCTNRPAPFPRRPAICIDSRNTVPYDSKTSDLAHGRVAGASPPFLAMLQGGFTWASILSLLKKIKPTNEDRVLEKQSDIDFDYVDNMVQEFLNETENDT